MKNLLSVWTLAGSSFTVDCRCVLTRVHPLFDGAAHDEQFAGCEPVTKILRCSSKRFTMVHRGDQHEHAVTALVVNQYAELA